MKIDKNRGGNKQTVALRIDVKDAYSLRVLAADATKTQGIGCTYQDVIRNIVKEYLTKENKRG